MDKADAVRKSIVRISFKWPNPSNEGKIQAVVIGGLIVSIKDDGSCLVFADHVFFRQENCPFVVNLPVAGGYDAVPVAPSMQFFVQGFCALVLQVQPNGYVQPVTCETRSVGTLETVYAFMFPQEAFFTPTAYCPGHIVHEEVGDTFIFHIPFHSFARFGSPIFNTRGHLVGISYQDMEARPVSFLWEHVFGRESIRSVLGSVSYVLDGNPIPPEDLVLPEDLVPPENPVLPEEQVLPI